MLTLDKVYHAAFKLKEVIRPTDLIHAPQINPDADVYLKTENLQVTGSFKVRGAYYKISTLTEEEKKHGVIACSAGNHAQGVALAAQRSGIKSIICLPDGAPISKVEATRSYGAEICLVEGVYDDAYNKALQLRDEHGYTFIHPFNDEDVIAGQDNIEFLISTNPGEEPKPLAKIASGGELSRIMLAFKSALADKDAISTVIYDEIDTGVSGLAAGRIGQKLKQTASGHQVLCITHTPQIAAFADNQLLIEKKVRDNRTFTEIHPLDLDGRVQVLARMISGDKVTDLSLANARELIEKSQGRFHHEVCISWVFDKSFARSNVCSFI